MTAKCQLKLAAKEQGLKRYESNNPCSKGHGFERLVSNSSCSECARELRRQARKKNPVKERSSMWRTQLKRIYGLSPQQYNFLFDAQDGCCAICKKKLISRLDDSKPIEKRKFGQRPNVACVDHDHATKQVRGLLCSECNIGVGKFRDDEKLLLQAVRYLRESATANSSSRVQLETLQDEGGPCKRDPDQIDSRVSRRQELTPFYF